MKQAEIAVQYLDHLGTDLTVANAARTSFGKESSWDEFPGMMNKRSLKPADANLIRFLATGFRTKDWDALLDEVIDHARHGSKGELTEILQGYKKSAQHWAPFGHPHMQIRMKLPIFLARQFVKHQIGGTWSEESRRYMSSEPEFWFPKEWHGRPEDIKQGSEGRITHMTWNDGGDVEREEIAPIVRELTAQQLHAYMQMVEGGVAPEEARIVLPLNTMTTVTWTGSLLFWSRVCNQRLDNHAQKAANELAEQIAAIAQPIFPVSWAALVGD
ncbi:MAG TPA: FAD-dependent thymidylate synthase [Thiobacillus sp.]|uniref:FAD-dependent thymidylate synthase n=1 Tax=Acidovorax sp. TaxID=1872122 RepID=UPI00261CC7CC|nr:FAD-dependent thymidylate synthase [Acidovorax sp.]HQT19110.1 FAD-dependent thymidylate synthase [Acidovorax defluvii]HQT71420.1 FAD-dependent thymidylate synthase [Thiobacillus sp.]